MKPKVAANSKKTGRNDPCPCGSGKKFKKCCGAFSSPQTTNSIEESYELLQQGSTSQAEADINSLVHASPNNSEAIYQLALIRYQQGKLTDSCELMKRKLKLDPDNSEVHCNLSRVLFELEDYSQSEFHARKAIKLDQSAYEGFNNLANSLKAQGRYSEAIKNFERAIERNPNNPWLHVNLGSVHHLEGNLEHAKSIYNESLEIDPGFVPALNNIAAIHIATQDYSLALSCYEKVIASGQIDIETANNIGRIYAALDNEKEARSWYQKAIDMDPKHIGTYINLAKLSADRGQHDEALKYYDKVLRIEPNNPNVLLAAASVEEERHRLVEAETLALRALNVEDCDRVEGSLELSKIYRRQKRYSESRILLQSVESGAISTAKTASFFHYEMGRHFEHEKQYDEAYKSFRMANSERRSFRAIGYDHEEFVKKFSLLRNVFDTSVGRLSQRKSGDRPLWPQPIFIVGFPRSGTTLMEQMLSSHGDVTAGGELSVLGQLQASMGSLLKSKKAYPECLLDIAVGDQEKLAVLRNFYLEGVRARGVVDEETRWFTDKMPLNVTALGLINMIFPVSPIIAMQRNPMDTCLSAYFTDFKTGNEYSLNILDTVRFYIETMKLTGYYQAELKLHDISVVYETLVEKPESELRRVLEFIGLPWDQRCMQFYRSRNVARTASYEQVTRPIYKTSVARYKHYEHLLTEPLQVLLPVMKKLGYL